MRYAVSLPNFGICGDPKQAAAFARLAEDSCWAAFFLWDHFLWTWPRQMEVADPYIALAACATATTRVRLGPMISPLPRYRPWHVARMVATLDHLSGGRLVLGVGIGGDWFGDYTKFGLPDDRPEHGEMLDESLDVITGLWSGEPFSYEGKHYTIREATLLPRPIQQPRVPVWVAGVWPHKKPFERAARWDGVVPMSVRDWEELTPDEVRAMMALVGEHRTTSEPFDLVVSGRSTGSDPSIDRDHLRPLIEAGATWWMEGFGPDEDPAAVRERIAQGPPQV